MNKLSLKKENISTNEHKKFLSDLPVDPLSNILSFAVNHLNCRLVSKHFSYLYQNIPLLKRNIQIPISWETLYDAYLSSKEKEIQEKINFAKEYGIDLKFKNAKELIHFVKLENNKQNILEGHTVTGFDFDMMDFEDYSKELDMLLAFIKGGPIFKPETLSFYEITMNNIEKVEKILTAFHERQKRGLPLIKLAIYNLTTSLDLTAFPDLLGLIINVDRLDDNKGIKLTLPTYTNLQKLGFRDYRTGSKVKKVLDYVDSSQVKELSFKRIFSDTDLDLKDFKNLEKLEIQSIENYKTINSRLADIAANSIISKMVLGSLEPGTVNIKNFKNVRVIKITGMQYGCTVNLENLEKLEILEIGNIFGIINLNNLKNLKKIIVSNIHQGELIAQSDLPSLVEIRFHRMGQVEVDVLLNFIKRCPAIQTLHLGDITKDLDLSKISEKLKITYTSIKDRVKLKLPMSAEEQLKEKLAEEELAKKLAAEKLAKKLAAEEIDTNAQLNLFPVEEMSDRTLVDLLLKLNRMFGGNSHTIGMFICIFLACVYAYWPYF